MGLLLCFGLSPLCALHAAAPPTGKVLASWADIEAVVTNVYEHVGAPGGSVLLPPMPASSVQSLTPRPFDPEGVSGLTNGATPSLLLGVPT